MLGEVVEVLAAVEAGHSQWPEKIPSVGATRHADPLGQPARGGEELQEKSPESGGQ